MASPSPPRKVLIGVGWPYAQGSLHLGHIVGAYLPADIFARYHRLAGNDVLMVSGSDVHGTPITVRAEEEGVTPQEVVDRYHPEFLTNWSDLGISWDLFTTTGTENHAAVAHDMFLRLRENGYLYRETMLQAFDPQAERFLPDRYVDGTCPHCAHEHARGDQCDNCGRTLDPGELVNPRSRLTGAAPVWRETEHYFLQLSALQGPILDWLESREGWRKHVQNFAIGFVEDGLKDRAFTRDLDWGIPLPVDDLGPGKVIYVWWEAVMGYLSAAKEWAQIQGDPDAWRAWWEDPGALTYYFIGKDNVPFHAIFWPAMLMGYGGLNLPTDVPANQHLTFKGEKASKSRGVGLPLSFYTERLQPDAIRYALTVSMPEQNDTDMSNEDMARRINDELAATWGNLVNRVVSLIHRTFAGTVPEPGDLDDGDRDLLADVATALAEAGEHIAAVRLRAGVQAAMRGAQATNVYLNRTEPWHTAKTDMARTGTTLHTALDAIATVNVALAPYLPFSAQTVHELLGGQGDVGDGGWTARSVAAGTTLGEPAPLFAKVDAADLEG